jgi:DNA-binding Xre family transcriptional regulator
LCTNCPLDGEWYKSLCEIEDNKTDVKLSTLRKIAAAMNCEVSDLV